MLTLINLIFTTAVIIVLVALTLHYFQAANEPGTETPPVSAYLKAWLGESVSITLAIMLVPISWLSRTFQKTGHSQGPAVAVVSTSLLGSPAPCLMLQWSLWRAGLTNVHAIALPHARGSLDKMATSLKQQLAALAQQAGRGQPLTVLAHGSAGLVLRNILESPELPQLGRVLTLGCPHQGTMSAVFFRPQTSLQLRPGSGFLASLPEPPAHWVSFYSDVDQVVIPARSANAGQGSEGFSGHGHFQLILSPKVCQAAVEHLLELSPRSTSSAPANEPSPFA